MKPSFSLRITRIALRLIQLLLAVTFVPIVLSRHPLAQRTFRFLMTLLEKGAAWLFNFRYTSTVSLEETPLASVPVIWVVPSKLSRPDKTVIYVHGGAMFLGSISTHGAVVSRIATQLGCRVLFINYALAPENPVPHAVEQVFNVYCHLLAAGGKPEQWVIGGDSAGCSLVLATLMKLRDAALPLPCAAFLESPFVDLSLSGASVIENGLSECLLPSGVYLTRVVGRRLFRSNYCRGYALTDPFVSPLFGSFQGLPPLYVCYSENEMIRDDATRLIAKAKAEGVKLTVQTFAATPHVNILFFEFYPEAREGLRQMLAFIAEALNL
jgi:acetyl esterase/lipase